jgi:hypothetical protein
MFPLTGGASANRCLRAEPKIERDGLRPMEEPALQLFEHCGDDPNLSRFQGFLPEWAKIDNENTWVYGKNRSGRAILKRPLRVQERESCMGYPDDYVHGPGKFCE